MAWKVDVSTDFQLMEMKDILSSCSPSTRDGECAPGDEVMQRKRKRHRQKLILKVAKKDSNVDLQEKAQKHIQAVASAAAAAAASSPDAFHPDASHSGQASGLKASPFDPEFDIRDSRVALSYSVDDLAIASAHVMLHKEDPLEAARLVLEGYHQTFPLEPKDVAALFGLILKQVCRVVIEETTRNFQLPKANRSPAAELPGRKLLNVLKDIHPEFAHCFFRSACGDNPPCPQNPPIVTWLWVNRGRFAPNHNQGIADPEASNDWMSRQMAAAGAIVGVGRHNEACASYSSGDGDAPPDGAPEPRAVRLGVDLFCPAGTPVFAPLKGTVHSFQDSAAADDDDNDGLCLVLEHRVNLLSPLKRGDAGGGARTSWVKFYTLYCHLSPESLRGKAPGQRVVWGERLGTLGDACVSGVWPPHLHFQLTLAMLGRRGDFPGVAPPDQAAAWRSLCPDPNLILGIPDSSFPKMPMSARKALPLAARHLAGGPSIPYTPQSLLGLRVVWGERLGTLGDACVSGVWPPHLHFQLTLAMLGRRGDFPGVAPPDQAAAWRSLCPDPNLILGIPDSSFPKMPMSARKALPLAARHLAGGPSIPYTPQSLLGLVRGEGQYLYDDCGRQYLDAVNGAAHVGHCHPTVVKAAKCQMGLLNINPIGQVSPAAVEYAQRLCATLSAPLSVCLFTRSGSEAFELALRVARAHTRQQGVIIAGPSFYDQATGAASAGGPPFLYAMPPPKYLTNDWEEYQWEALEVMDEVEDEEARERVREAVERASSAAGGPGMAAFVCEAVLGHADYVVPRERDLAAAYEHTRRAGGVCIADETETSLGRLGVTFWGFQMHAVVPNIVVGGEALGNGHPMGAVFCTPALAASFSHAHNGGGAGGGVAPLRAQYGGDPVACAVGSAVLDVIEGQGLQANARAAGAEILENPQLNDYEFHVPFSAVVRGRGLLTGVHFLLNKPNDRRSSRDRLLAPLHAEYVARCMAEMGVLVGIGGPDRNVLYFKPPLVFIEADANRVLELLNFILEVTPTEASQIQALRRCQRASLCLVPGMYHAGVFVTHALVFTVPGSRHRSGCRCAKLHACGKRLQIK
eukprot:jgi/Mesen1/4978/ME000248S04262